MRRWSGPTTARTTWGTTRPTKAIGPASAVAEAASRIAPAAARSRWSSTRWPRPRARSSPRATVLSTEPEAKGEREADDEEGRDVEDDPCVAAGDRPDLPEAEDVEGALVGDEDGADDARRGRHDGGAGQRHRHGLGAHRREQGEQLDDDGGDDGSDEGEPDVAADARDREELDADDDGEGGAGVDAEDPRLGERVAGQALEDDAADARPRHPTTRPMRVRSTREATMPATSSVTGSPSRAATTSDGATDWVPTSSESIAAMATATSPPTTITATGTRPPRPTFPARWAGAAGLSCRHTGRCRWPGPSLGRSSVHGRGDLGQELLERDRHRERRRRRHRQRGGVVGARDVVVGLERRDLAEERVLLEGVDLFGLLDVEDQRVGVERRGLLGGEVGC